MINRRNFLGLSMMAASALTGVGCTSQNSGDTTSEPTKESSDVLDSSNNTIRLALSTSGHIFNAVAEDQGYLADEGIAVELVNISGEGDAFSAMFSNKVDILSNYGTNLPLQHISAGQNLSIIGGYMLTGCMPIIAKAGTTWNGVEDLIGKTIACSGDEFAVFGPLYDMGYDPKNQIQMQVIDSHPDRIEAVKTGKLNYAIVGTGQNYNVNKMSEIDVMCYCSDITPDYSCCRVECSDEFKDSHKAALKGMLKAWLRAQAYYENNKEYAEELVANQTNVTKEFVAAYVENEHLRLNVDPYKKSVQRAWKYMSDMNLLNEGADKIDLDAHIDIDLYKSALDECVEEHYDEAPEFYDKMQSIYQEQDA